VEVCSTFRFSRATHGFWRATQPHLRFWLPTNHSTTPHHTNSLVLSGTHSRLSPFLSLYGPLQHRLPSAVCLPLLSSAASHPTFPALLSQYGPSKAHPPPHPLRRPQRRLHRRSRQRWRRQRRPKRQWTSRTAHAPDPLCCSLHPLCAATDTRRRLRRTCHTALHPHPLQRPPQQRWALHRPAALHRRTAAGSERDTEPGGGAGAGGGGWGETKGCTAESEREAERRWWGLLCWQGAAVAAAAAAAAQAQGQVWKWWRW
jgi:hypothetical protein